MPCRCDYMEPNEREREGDRVRRLLDELDGKGRPDPVKYGSGSHESIYWQQFDLDAMTKELCSRLQGASLAERSLEMQIWWRDHQRMDREREARENSSRG